MSLFLAEDLMLPLLSPIHATTKKERNSRFSPLSTQSRCLGMCICQGQKSTNCVKMRDVVTI